MASAPETEKVIRDRFERCFRNEVELFASSAGRPSLRLMLDFLARWNEIHNDPEAKTGPCTLAVAAEIELNRFRADAAAEAARKGAS